MRNLRRSDKHLLAGLLLLSQVIVVAPEDAQMQDSKEDRSYKTVEHYPVVSIDAQVTSKTSGSMVRDLTHKDFTISENSVRQNVCSFWQRFVTPLSLLIVLDVATTDPNSQHVTDRVQGLKSSLTRSLRQEDQVSVMVLTESPTLLQDYTGDKGLILAAFDRALQRKGPMRLPAEKRFRIALQEAARRAANAPNPEARRVIALISDLPKEIANEIVVPEWLLRRVIEPATTVCWQRSRVLSSGITDEQTTFSARNTLSGLVLATGGEEFADDWKSLLERLRERYRLAYYADTLGRSGELVRIKLEIKPSAKSDSHDLVLTYRQFAIVPFSTR